MDNCYSGKDRIPRELLHSVKDERMSKKHLQTLTFLQDLMKENEQLRQRKEEMEKEQEKCQEIHALAEESARRIKDIEENCLKRADQVNQEMSEEHRAEMMQLMDEKMEMERTLKEEKLKLRHDLDSLRRTTAVLQEDTEWVLEKKDLLNKITELELLVEGLQIDANEKKSTRDDLKTSLNKTRTNNSEMHQVQELRTLNQNLKEELAEAVQKSKEYKKNIKRLECELRDEGVSEEEHVRLTQALDIKTSKLTREVEAARMREEGVRSECREVAEINVNIERRVGDLRDECGRLMRELDELHRECSRLDRRRHDDEKDKEFWQVRRQVEALRHENQALKAKVKAAAEASSSSLSSASPSSSSRVVLSSSSPAAATSSSSSLCSLPLLKDDNQGQGPGSRPASSSRNKKERKKKLSIGEGSVDGSPFIN